MTGLGGADSFLFDAALGTIAVVTDFSVADDTIRLDQTIFSSSLGLGNISSGELVIGTAALEANDRIIYDSSTGALFYDADGVCGRGAGGGILKSTDTTTVPDELLLGAYRHCKTD